jgi:hypothetical protein
MRGEAVKVIKSAVRQGFAVKRNHLTAVAVRANVISTKASHQQHREK